MYKCPSCEIELERFQNHEFKCENCIDGKVYDVESMTDEEIEIIN